MAFGERVRPEFWPVEEATPDEEQPRASVAAAAAAAAAAGAPTPGPVPPASARAAAAGAILAGLVAFLAAQRARLRVWLREQMRRRAPSASQEDIERLIAEEEERQTSFERKAAERFARDLTVALAIPDQTLRERAVRGLTAREQRYARQREQAMAARAFAAVDRVVLRESSPLGAFWKLDPTVIEHTAGCLVMGGKFHPWPVLDRVHPPRHPGCPCRLIGYGEALAEGLMTAGDVLDVQTAIRRAAAVVMEGALLLPADDAEALIESAGGRELMELRTALLGGGLADEAALDGLLSEDWRAQPRDPGGAGGGQWTKSGGVGVPKVMTAVWGRHAPKGGKRKRPLKLHWFDGDPRQVVYDADFFTEHRISIEGVARVRGGNVEVVAKRRNDYGDEEDESSFAYVVRRAAVEAGHVTPEQAALADRFDNARLSLPRPPSWNQVDRWQDSKGGGDSSTLSIPVLDRPAHYFVALHELAHHALGHKPELKRVGREMVATLDAQKELEAWRWAFDYENRKIAGTGVPVDDETRELVRTALASYGVSADTVLPPKIAEEWEFVGDPDVELMALMERFDPDQPRWPKGHPNAGQWRPKLGVGFGVKPGQTGKRAEKATARKVKDIEDLRAMLAPSVIGSDSNDEPIYDRVEHWSAQEVQRVGRAVHDLAERYGTWREDRKRIDALHAERRVIFDAKQDRIEAAGGHDKLLDEYGEAKKNPVDPAATLTYRQWVGQRFADPKDEQRMRAIDAEVLRLRKSEHRGKQDAIRGVLAEVRPMGGKVRVGKVEETIADTPVPATSNAVEALERSLAQVQRLVPSAWIEDSNAGETNFLIGSGRAWHRALKADWQDEEDALDLALSRHGGFEFAGYSPDGQSPILRRKSDSRLVWINAHGQTIDFDPDANFRGGRGFTPGPRRPRRVDSTIKVQAGDDSTLLHELAHRFEQTAGERNVMTFSRPLLSLTTKFLRDRAGSSDRVKLKDLRPDSGYEDHEETWEDDFVDPYMGKDYAGRTTEVLTMGLQAIFFPEYGRELDPPKSRGKKGDPAMRDFILGLLAAA